MNFVTISFVFFFLVVLAAMLFCKRGSTLYKIFLLVFNIAFYSFAGISFLPLLLLIVVCNCVCAKYIYKLPLEKIKAAKLCLGFNIGIHIFLLAFYKYYKFVLISLESIFNYFGLNSPFYELIAVNNVYLPIGLSFYIFQGLSYSIDIYRSRYAVKDDSDKSKLDIIGEPQNFLNVFIFISFFPTILAGPLMRANDFFSQLNGQHIFEKIKVADVNNASEDIAINLSYNAKLKLQKYINRETITACCFILSGLFKKVVLASYLSEHIVRDVFMTPDIYSSLTILIAIYAYAMQIYCDFSGYSDLAVGVGKLLGYDLPRNFNAPYIALSLQDFWRRWHISLSTWLRDYLYIPLGGNRKGFTSLNLIITMTLGGLWHGSHLNFLIWGFFHGVGLTLSHFIKNILGSNFDSYLTKQKEKNLFGKYITSPIKSFVAWFLTFHFVCLLWVFFRADNRETAFFMIKRAAEFNVVGSGFQALAIIVILCAFFIQFVGSHIFKWFTCFLQIVPIFLQIIVIAILCAFILKLGPSGVMPFIYFQF